jgi:DNA-binding beta-propeller fold protein YncE
MPKAGRLAVLVIALAASLATSFIQAARADMTLTAAGVAEGFTISTFVSGFPNFGPQGIAFPTSGGVMVTDVGTGTVSVFADTDGQVYGAGVPGQTYGSANATGLATSGGQMYMTQQSLGRLVTLNNNGTFAGVAASGLASATGIATNPVTGALYISNAPAGGTIYKYDPVTKVATPFITNSTYPGLNADGLAVSADGTKLYAANWGGNGHVLVFNALTGAFIADLGFVAGTPDGIAIGQSGSIAGDLFVNTNGGTVVEINTTTLVQTIIAAGGSRGDFVSVDPNGTLLLTQTNDILRLTPLEGSFAVPGPVLGAGLPGLILAAGGLLGWRRRKRKAEAAA